MNKKCGKCDKTVYPTEELKCLDKVWHKACFKCQVCNMTLNMKNYKGFDKLPYCNAHYPKTSHTQVADTPESRRIQQNTKLQSNIQYHSDFEKQKGKKTSVADDPETMRIKQNTENISNVTYHGVRKAREEMEQRRPFDIQDENEVFQRPHKNNPRKISDYEPSGNDVNSPYSARTQSGVTNIYDSEQGAVEKPTRRVGSIADYDPMNERYGSIAQPTGGVAPQQPPPQQYQQPPQQQQQQPYQPQRVGVRLPQGPGQPAQPAPPPPAAQPPQQTQNRYSGKGMVCKAMYDYAAGDSDEVGFDEGDMIIFCQPIDSGWMEGTVERSNQRGMLPSNYVERVA